jgi:hypothetical protein
MAKFLIEKSIEAFYPNGKAVTEVYETTNSDMPTDVSGLIGAAASGYSGETTPYCMQARGIGNYWETGRARVEAAYRTRTWPEWFYANQNYAKVFHEPAFTQQARKRDLQDRLIEGVDEVDQTKWWEIDSGENFNLLPKERIVIRAVVNDAETYLDPFSAATFGTTNSADMPNVDAGATAGKMLYMGRSITPILDDSALFEVSYTFLLHNLAWDDQCICQKYGMQWRRYPLYDSGGNLVAGYRVGLVKTAIAGQSFSADLFTTTDFSTINTMCGTPA